MVGTRILVRRLSDPSDVLHRAKIIDEAFTTFGRTAYEYRYDQLVGHQYGGDVFADNEGISWCRDNEEAERALLAYTALR